MAIPPPRRSCPRSSAPSPGPASGTGTWNRSMTTAPARASGGCTAWEGMPVTCLWRRHRAGAQPRTGRGHAGGGMGDGDPRPQMDRLPQHAARGRGRAYRAGRRTAHRRHRAAPARLLPGPHLDEHGCAWLRGRRLRVSGRHDRGRAALLARPQRPPAADGALHDGRQRHALFQRPGLRHGHGLLRLSARQLRHALCRRRGGFAQDDVHRPALPPRRPARTRACTETLS